MKVYENNYVYGRDLLKKLLIAAVIAAVGTVVAQPGSGLFRCSRQIGMEPTPFLG